MGTSRRETRAQIALKCYHASGQRRRPRSERGHIKEPVLVRFNSRQFRRALRPLRRVRTLRGVRSWLSSPDPGNPRPRRGAGRMPRCRSRCAVLPGATGGGFGWFSGECHLERADDPRARPPKIPTEPCVPMMIGTRIASYVVGDLRGCLACPVDSRPDEGLVQDCVCVPHEQLNLLAQAGGGDRTRHTVN